MTTEPRRRPILHLKLGAVTRPLGPAALVKPAKPAKPAPPPPQPAPTWKCRPCGAAFTPPVEAADDDAVRCPACNAKLGPAGEFRQATPNLERLRARPIKR